MTGSNARVKDKGIRRNKWYIRSKITRNRTKLLTYTGVDWEIGSLPEAAKEGGILATRSC